MVFYNIPFLQDEIFVIWDMCNSLPFTLLFHELGILVYIIKVKDFVYGLIKFY